MTRLSRLSLAIYHARRDRDATVTPEAYASANARVAAAFEAWNQARKESI